jgi:hypothetical protein
MALAAAALLAGAAHAQYPDRPVKVIKQLGIRME